MEFKGRETLFVIFVALLVVPLQVAFIPIVQLYGTLGIQGSFLGIWLAHSGFGMPLAVYLLRNYIGSLPREVIESAKVDGASHFSTFVRLILPLSVPALAAFAIFQFLWTWNDYLVALILLDTARVGQVSTTYLAGLLGTFGQNAHLLSAGAFVTMIVPLIVFFSLQRFFVRGLTAGSVKG
jgi:alpha-glucoside transport system permease protein